uniref:TACI cysteine-rich domain-containing protein n=1 Tax=Naja naja TaxID=35670 RepID=A0A8C6Y8Z6_NAJNA
MILGSQLLFLQPVVLFLETALDSDVHFQRIMQCLKDQYWDGLLGNCVSCKYACQPLKFQGCADVCNSLECSKQEGSYYDQLLRQCVKCFSICGQHPKQCAPFCRSKSGLEQPPLPPSTDVVVLWGMKHVQENNQVREHQGSLVLPLLLPPKSPLPSRTDNVT